MIRGDLLAIVPARGGSKGVPGKNIKVTGGQPLIVWTIQAALRAISVARTVVTTDSQKIAAVAKMHGAEVPFLRPEELAGDETPGILPILHTLNWLAEFEGYRPDYVCCLQPTSPLRTSQDIDAALRVLVEKQADAVVSVTPAKHHPSWLKTMDEEGRVKAFLDRGENADNRQDLLPLYALNGAIYLARRTIIQDFRTWYTERTYAYVMPASRSLDIDTVDDLSLADLLLSGITIT